MKSLEEENKKLKAEIEKLKARIKILEMQLEGNQFAAREALKKYNEASLELKGKTHRINPINSEFIAGRRTLLRLDDVEIVFDSPNDKAALLAKAICKPSRLKKLVKGPVGIDDLYEWYTGKDDWYNNNDDSKDEERRKEREKFKKDLYQWFRRINDKAAVRFNGRKVFITNDKEYRFNPGILKDVPVGTR